MSPASTNGRWRVAYVARQHRWTQPLEKIRIFQTVSNEKTINMKVVDPNKL
jgi:hypothetical protein